MFYEISAMTFEIDLYEAIYTFLTQDTVLQSIWNPNPVALYNSLASPNVEFPYLVMELQEATFKEPGDLAEEMYLEIDVWWRLDHTDAQSNVERYQIKDRIKKILHDAYYQGPRGTARFYFKESYEKDVFVSGNIPVKEIRCTTLFFCLRTLDNGWV